MSPDPIGYGGGMNMYNYAGSGPVNKWDPWGLEEALIGYIYEITNKELQFKNAASEMVDIKYVGSGRNAASRLTNPRHPIYTTGKDILGHSGTEIKVRPVYADLDINGSRRGTRAAARNEALRAAEQKVMNQARIKPKQVNSLNKYRAATPENLKIWKGRHSVRVGTAKTIFKVGDTGADAAKGALRGLAQADDGLKGVKNLKALGRATKVLSVLVVMYVLYDEGAAAAAEETVATVTVVRPSDVGPALEGMNRLITGDLHRAAAYQERKRKDALNVQRWLTYVMENPMPEGTTRSDIANHPMFRHLIMGKGLASTPSMAKPLEDALGADTVRNMGIGKVMDTLYDSKNWRLDGWNGWNYVGPR